MAPTETLRYLDTSAALKLLVQEAESDGLARDLMAPGSVLVSSMLLFTELHCAADRRGFLHPVSVNLVLDSIALVDLTRDDLVRAATSRWGLRSADALHLSTALRIEADEIVTYDQELADAALRVGITVSSPG
ncbi:type II toxin-antitoxin system VapC family toxin [Ornithinimicrobium panacihumi]|uniref:type II toxin-antitoxin system VapC family toxin n=1 Tax=Ornithinimicrobium panacihumi TaxID=2008449 RepID=UPI003F8CC4D1